MSNVTQLANSLEEYWMPFTANRAFKANPRIMTGASGVYYTSHQGRQIIDGSSGLFCVAAGHGRPEIAEAVHKTLLEMDYVPPFQHGHPMSFELARRLARITPGDLNQIFFTNSGSESVDTALKVALAYHKARGEGSRTRFVGRELSYHGVNFGGVSVAGMVNNRKAFGIGLPGAVHMRHTKLPENAMTIGQAENGAELAEDLQRFCDLHGPENIAACIVEPIAGSIGCLVPPKGYLERLREICDANGILLIFDEVICAFGRTGKQFGSEAFGVVPDMITMAKALTNGVVPMGAVACSEKLFDALAAAAPEWAIELFHGYTYSGCPVASAAGLATRDIFEKEDLVGNAAKMAPAFQEAVADLGNLPVVTDVRAYGLLAGVDVATLDGMPGKRGLGLVEEFYEEGVMTKLTGDCILIAPPLVSTEENLDEIFTKIRNVLTRH
jgi:beta-alanine--pyruvate transaminase